MSLKNKIKDILGEPEKRASAFGAALLLAFTLLFFGPSYIYYGNILEIPYYYADMVWLFLAYSLAAGVIISIILLFLKGIFHQRAVAFVFAMGVLFWIQGHILVWDYGILDGRAIIWEDYNLNGIIDSVIWIGILAIALIKGPVLYKHIALVSVLLLVVQGVGLTAEVYQAPDEPEWKEDLLGIDKTTMFEFSPEQNVIIIVLDMFQSDLFQEIIDEEPKYRDLFDGFTYYRNAVGGHPTTLPSVTYILSGKEYTNSIPILEHIKESFLENSLPLTMKESGYRTELYPIWGNEIYKSKEVASNIILNANNHLNQITSSQIGVNEIQKMTMYRFVPHFLKRFFHTYPFDYNQDGEFNKKLTSESTTQCNTKVFKYYHLRGVHYPYVLNSQLKKENLPNDRTGAKEQARAALKITSELFNQLKRLNIYDKSMIFVVSDHGNPEASIGLNDTQIVRDDVNNSQIIANNVVTSGIPLMLVKPFDSVGDLLTTDSPVTLGDIPRTISDYLQLPYVFPGQSIFTINKTDERERKYYYYQWKNSPKEQGYLPPIQEYIIVGHSWLHSSWNPTYREYNTRGKESSILPIYVCGTPIIFGVDGTSEKYQINGWSSPEEGFTWTEGHKSILGIQTAITNSDLNLSIKASQFTGKQRVNVTVNNHHVGNWEFDRPEVQEKSIIIPQEVLNEDMQYITFELPDAKSTQSLGLSGHDRTLSLAVQSIVITNSTEPIYHE